MARVARGPKPWGVKIGPIPTDGVPRIKDCEGKYIELILQGHAFCQDEKEIGRLTYVTPNWVGFVSTSRSQLYYDHVPISSIRKISEAGSYALKQLRAKKIDPFRYVDFDNPPKIIDLVNEEILLYLQGNPIKPDQGFKTRLVYVSKHWIGTSSSFNGKAWTDHIPISSVRRVASVFLKPKEGRFLPKHEC